MLRRDRSLDEIAAAGVWGAVLDGAVDDVDVGAMVAALALTGETREELAGLQRAARERLAPWRAAPRSRAIAIPAYGVMRGESLLVALLATLLPRFDVPVLVHGVLDSPRGADAARLLRALGLMPCVSLEGAEASIAARGAAFVPARVFAPALAAIMALRARMGFANSAHLVAQALDPTGGRAVRMTFCAEGEACERYRLLAAAARGDSIALTWPAGSSPANLFVRPRIEWLREAAAQLLFEADLPDPRPAQAPPGEGEAEARWITRVARGEIAVPPPALHLIAACLHAVGGAPDLSRAKAAAAIQAGRLAA